MLRILLNTKRAYAKCKTILCMNRLTHFLFIYMSTFVSSLARTTYKVMLKHITSFTRKLNVTSLNLNNKHLKSIIGKFNAQNLRCKLHWVNVFRKSSKSTSVCWVRWLEDCLQINYKQLTSNQTFIKSNQSQSCDKPSSL